MLQCKFQWNVKRNKAYFHKLKEIEILRPIFPDYVISCDYGCCLFQLICNTPFIFKSNLNEFVLKIIGLIWIKISLILLHNKVVLSKWLIWLFVNLIKSKKRCHILISIGYNSILSRRFSAYIVYMVITCFFLIFFFGSDVFLVCLIPVVIISFSSEFFINTIVINTIVIIS